LPETLWSALQQAAKADGLTPAAWIASRLPSTTGENGTTASPAPESEPLDEQEPPS
jgi:hypothetical protein